MNANFDYVIGNPPYSTSIVDKKEHKEYYDKMGKGVKHSALTFILKAIDNLKAGGSVIYIIPANGLCLKDSDTFRKYVLDNGSITDLYYTNKDLFDGAVTQGNLMIIKITKNIKSETSIIIDYSNGLKYETKYVYDSEDVFPIVISEEVIDATKNIMSKANILDVLVKPGHNTMGTKEFPIYKDKLENANEVICKINRGKNLEIGYTYGTDTSHCWKVVFSSLCKVKEIFQEGGIACALIPPEKSVAFAYSYITCGSKEEAEFIKEWFHHPLFVISLIQFYDNSYLSDGNLGRLSIPPMNVDVWDYYDVSSDTKEIILSLYKEIVETEQQLMRKSKV